MSGDHGVWWVLGFDYTSVVDGWKDARLANDLERAWLAAGRPEGTSVLWMPSDDEYAFRWYVSVPAGDLLDRASIVWRTYVIGHVDEVPHGARPLVLGDGHASP